MSFYRRYNGVNRSYGADHGSGARRWISDVLDAGSLSYLSAMVAPLAVDPDTRTALRTFQISGSTSAEQLANWLFGYGYVHYPLSIGEVLPAANAAIPDLLRMAQAKLLADQARDTADREAAAPKPVLVFAPVAATASAAGSVASMLAAKAVARAANSDSKASRAGQASAKASKVANAAVHKANEAAASSGPDKEEAAANARADAKQKQANAIAAAKAHQDAVDQANADAANAQAAIDKANAKAHQDAVDKANQDAANLFNSGGGGSDSGGGGGYGTIDGIPDGAYGGEGVGYTTWTDGSGALRRSVIMQEQQLTGGGPAVPMTVDPVSGNPVPVSLLKQHPYVATAGAAGVGFLVGGPIGALVGAAVGFFTSRS